MSTLDGSSTKPKRKWIRKTLKYLSVFIGSLLLLLALVWVVWAWFASSRLQNEIARIRAMGEPTTLADLVPTTMPSEMNNRILQLGLLREQSQIRTELADRFKQDFPEIPIVDPLSKAELDLLNQFIAERTPLLQAMDKALALPEAAVPFDTSATLTSNRIPALQGYREAANHRKHRAIVAMLSNDQRSAWDHIEQMDLFADDAMLHRVVVGYLVSVSIQFLQSLSLEALSVELDIGDGPQQVSRNRVDQRIVKLMDHSASNAALIRATKTERIFSIEGFADFKKSWTFLTRPFWNDSLYFALRQIELDTNRLVAPDLPAYNLLCRQSPDVITRGSSDFRKMFGSVFLPSFSRVATHNFRSMTDREIAATALAVRLYRLDHQDQFPPDLQTLVPNYLPRLPRDYLAGTPLNYDPVRRILFGLNRDNTILNNGVGYRDKFRAADETEKEFERQIDRVCYLDPKNSLRADQFFAAKKSTPAQAWAAALTGKFQLEGSEQTLVIEQVPADASGAMLFRASCNPFVADPFSTSPVTLKLIMDSDATGLLSIVEAPTVATISLHVDTSIDDLIRAVASGRSIGDDKRILKLQLHTDSIYTDFILVSEAEQERFNVKFSPPLSIEWTRVPEATQPGR
jgi:hypothetical protein